MTDSQIVDLLTAILNRLDAIHAVIQPSHRPDFRPLLDAIERSTKGFRFTAASLLARAEIEAQEEGDERLQNILNDVAELNALRLGKILARLEGQGVRRVRTGRDGTEWKCDDPKRDPHT